MNPNEAPELKLPAVYSDGSNELCDALLEQVAADAPGIAAATERNRRQSIGKVRPILDRIGLYSLDQLSDLDVQWALRSAVSEALASGELGRGGTPDTHLRNFITVCTRLGLPDDERRHISGIFRQAFRAAEIEDTGRFEGTPELAAQVIQTGLTWLESVPTQDAGYHWVHADLPPGYQGRPLSPKRLARVLAWLAIQTSSGARSGDVNLVRRRDLTPERVTWRVRKGRKKTKRMSRPIIEPCRPLLGPILELVTDPDAYLFNVPKGPESEDTTTRCDLKALLIAAGIPSHNGRHGLHWIRSALVESARRAGIEASSAGAALGHRDPTTASKHYSEVGDRIGGEAATAAYQDSITDLLAPSPEYEMGDESGASSWGAMGVEGAPLAGAWRFIPVLIPDPEMSDGIASYLGYESNVGDLFVYLRGSGGRMTWLRKGDLHARWLRKEASEMVGPPGFEPGSIRPLESIVAGVARELRGCLARGEAERADVLLNLLEALGGEPA